MARSVERAINAEADRKGLTGTRREHYIGGAWDRVRHGAERRDAFRRSDDAQALAALGMNVQAVRSPRSKRGAVYFQESGKWYELPNSEYRGLVKEGRAALKEQRREREEYERGRRIYERELARMTREDAREARREQQRQAQLARSRDQEDRLYRRMKRAEHAEVLHRIKELGGIKRQVTQSGVESERGEYEQLPKHVRHTRSSRREGVTADEAAAVLHEDMPWLFTDSTSRVLYDYFEGHNVRRMHGHAA